MKRLLCGWRQIHQSLEWKDKWLLKLQLKIIKESLLVGVVVILLRFWSLGIIALTRVKLLRSPRHRWAPGQRRLSGIGSFWPNSRLAVIAQATSVGQLRNAWIQRCFTKGHVAQIPRTSRGYSRAWSLCPPLGTRGGRFHGRQVNNPTVAAHNLCWGRHRGYHAPRGCTAGNGHRGLNGLCKNCMRGQVRLCLKEYL